MVTVPAPTVGWDKPHPFEMCLKLEWIGSEREPEELCRICDVFFPGNFPFISFNF
jgi:hypothetical protein